MTFDIFCLSFSHEAAYIHSRLNMITAVLPVVFTFYLEFWHENVKPNVEGHMYKANRRKRGLPFVRAPRICS